MYSPRLSIWAVLTTLVGVPLPVHAQELPEIGEQAAPTEEQGEPPAAASGERRKKKADIIVAPVPFSSPSSGTGLAVGAVAFYNPNDSPHQWISGGGIVWTTRGSKGLAAFHKMSVSGDRIRITAAASYFDDEEKFYGIGDEAGDRGEALELSDEKFKLQVRAQMRAFPHGFVGLRYRLATIDAAPKGDSPTPPPPADQMHSTLSMLGPTFAYDTRDSHTQPRRGVDISASWLFGIEALGNSYDHNKFTLSASTYLPFGPATVLALNAYLCSAGGDVPYYNLCLFGANAALRGYPTGRYRDRASWAAQAELRQSITERWAGTAFFGVGGIARSPGAFLDDGNTLPAAGIGARYLPFKDNDVHLRLDIAIGKNDHGICLGIGEAF